MLCKNWCLSDDLMCTVSATWLSHGQLQATVEGAVSLNNVNQTAFDT